MESIHNPATTSVLFRRQGDPHASPCFRFRLRATINQINAQKSNGPRTEAGKERSSLNALRHGLTARTAVLDSENQTDYETHCRQFFDQYNRQ
jgi:hypothetical protein